MPQLEELFTETPVRIKNVIKGLGPIASYLALSDPVGNWVAGAARLLCGPL